jgi:hypothetical protein
MASANIIKGGIRLETVRKMVEELVEVKEPDKILLEMTTEEAQGIVLILGQRTGLDIVLPTNRAFSALKNLVGNPGGKYKLAVAYTSPVDGSLAYRIEARPEKNAADC